MLSNIPYIGVFSGIQSNLTAYGQGKEFIHKIFFFISDEKTNVSLKIPNFIINYIFLAIEIHHSGIFTYGTIEL